MASLLESTSAWECETAARKMPLQERRLLSLNHIDFNPLYKR